MTTTHETSTNGAGAPTGPTALERLRSIYGHEGPFVSVYLATTPGGQGVAEDLSKKWLLHRARCEANGASRAALDAVEARLALPAPEDTAAVGVLSARDGSTIVEYGLEPPREDVAHVDSLPYVAPILEWHQRRVAHVVVTVNEAGADVAVFGHDHFSSLDAFSGSAPQLVDPIVADVKAVGAELVIVAGDATTASGLADRLAAAVPVGCRVVADTDSRSVDQLADNTVRQVSDAAARTTVGLLREQRFLAAHGDSVDGFEDTIAALHAGRVDVVLLHDDPEDARRAVLDESGSISLDTKSAGTDVRLVDAVIRAAVLGGVDVHIIPTTGPRGPHDNAAALNRSGPIADEDR